MEIKKSKYGYISKNSFEIQIFAIAMHFFENYSYTMSFRKIDRFELATACVFLSSKLCNDFIKIETALEIFNGLKNITQAKNDKKLDLTKYEIELMSIIGFDLDFELPYNFIEQYTHQIIKEDDKRKKLLNLSFILVNDSYRRPLCLLFFPKYIALAAIYVACIILDSEDSFKFDEILEIDKELEKDVLLFCISEFDNCTNFNKKLEINN